MNRRLLALFFLLVAVLAVVAAPVDGNALEIRKAKAAARPKAVKRPAAKTKPVVKAKPKAVKKVAAKPKAVKKVAAKPKAVAKPKPAAKKVAAKPKTVAKPKTTAAKKTVAAKKPTTAAKKTVAAKKPTTAAKKTTAAKPKAVAAKPKTTATKKVAAKPKAGVPAKKTATAKPKAVAAKPKACPLPKKKTTVRRFLEYVGLSARADPPVDPACSTPAAPVDAKAAAKAKAKADKAAKAKAKADKAKADAAAAEAAKRKVGPVSNAPSNAVQCKNKDGALTEIPLASIKTAVKLAQAGPLITTKNAVKFPHVFDNREGVKVASACAGKTLEEQAVGPDMSTFQNVPSVLKNFNEFRVLITTPDATTGATTFCGVMTHGESTTGTFDKDLCTEV